MCDLSCTNDARFTQFQLHCVVVVSLKFLFDSFLHSSVPDDDDVHESDELSSLNTQKKRKKKVVFTHISAGLALVAIHHFFDGSEESFRFE